MSLAGCQIYPIDVNFHLPKVWRFFYKNSADKIWSKKDEEMKLSPPLMPIRVKLDLVTIANARQNGTAKNLIQF